MSTSLLKLGQSTISRHELETEARRIAIEIKNNVSDIVAIYFFGSAHNGVFTINSDIDLLVVFSDQAKMQINSKSLYAKRWSAYPLDLITVSEKEFHDKREFGGICFTAYNEGIQII